MILGISFGLTAAFLMSVSYIFSKWFMLRHRSAFLLTLYAQLFMGVLGLAVLACVYRSVSLPLTDVKKSGLILLTAALSIWGNFCFFRTLKVLEASRLSSLLGLKIVMLGAICMLFLHRQITLLQWTAILLGTVAAVGMNFTGGSLKAKAVFWLFLTLLGYSLGDLAAVGAFHAVGGENRILAAFAASGYVAVAQALLMLPCLLLKRVPKSRRLLVDCIPYSAGWFTALLFLYYCFGTLGVIYGTILQSARGLFSVALGALLLKFGWEKYEPRVGLSAWIRRLVMALLMFAAMTVYAFSKR